MNSKKIKQLAKKIAEEHYHAGIDLPSITYGEKYTKIRIDALKSIIENELEKAFNPEIKNCANCKNCFVSRHIKPCFDCDNYDNWENQNL